MKSTERGELSPSKINQIEVLLFDLDGTLVDMDPRFRFPLLVRAMMRFRHLIAPWRFTRAFWESVQAITGNQTEQVNYQVFLQSLADSAKSSTEKVEKIVQEVLDVDFKKSGRYFSATSGAKETLLMAKKKNLRCLLATNPMFPLKAVEYRLACGGFVLSDFEFITHSQNMSRCKPNVEYYRELVKLKNLDPAKCLMIGNDPAKDLPARLLGIPVFLLEGPQLKKKLKSNIGLPFTIGNHQALCEILSEIQR